MSLERLESIVVNKGDRLQEKFYTAMTEIRISEQAYNDPTPLPEMTMQQLFDTLSKLPSAVVQEDQEERFPEQELTEQY